MDNSEIKPVGGACGQHGPYTFYKAFRWRKGGRTRVVQLCEFFFVKLWSDSDLVSIGELQLLWQDRNSDQLLCSLRLYFLPENTPDGRVDGHGEDEVLAISEKVVLRLDDLLTWIIVDAEWNWGRQLGPPPPPPNNNEAKLDGVFVRPFDVVPTRTLLDNFTKHDFNDVEKERKLIEKHCKTPKVIILSYTRYCRYRAIMRRIESRPYPIDTPDIWALGGLPRPSSGTLCVLFCRDTFDYPELETHELLCNHLAPKMKGRPRGRKKKRSTSPNSESGSDVSVNSNVIRASTRRSPRVLERSAEEKAFTTRLHTYLRSVGSPLPRPPQVGSRELDLHVLFTRVQKLGGYDIVNYNKMWKNLANEFSGTTATLLRRNYERMLLSFERHEKGEEHKVSSAERRRTKSKRNSESDVSETKSSSTTPVPQCPKARVPFVQPTGVSTRSNDSKEFVMPEKTKSESKISSLRSVRVKQDRVRENLHKDKQKSTKDIPHTITSNTSSLPEKNLSNQPVITAVAPIADKPMPEKSASPLEGKENIPIMNSSKDIGKTKTNIDDDIIEVPYKPPTPVIIDLDPGNDNDGDNEGHDVKKRKLDILKEGGLEVTAVSSGLMKDIRPSVIQTSLIPPTFKHQLGNLSITLTSDTSKMPPPQTKKPYTISAVPNLHKRLPKDISNGMTAPKVVQSRSIFNYSEKIVYGNPKDPFIPPQPVAIPKVVTQQKVSDVLDLTVKSPQKPIVEIVRVPHVTSMTSRLQTLQHQPKNLTKSNSIPNLPQIEGRLGSNLEITLVSANNKINKQHVHSSSRSHKRTSNGTIKSPYKAELNIPRKTSLPNYTDVHNQAQNQKPTQYLPNNFPAYMSQLASKTLPFAPAQYFPFIDPMYYSALCSQNLGYPPSPLAAGPPLVPQTTSLDQLQLLKELMAQTARGRFPFIPPQDSNMTIKSNDNSSVKK